MAPIYLVELQAYDPAVPGVVTLRYASGRGYVTRPTETPANAYYAPKVASPASMRRDVLDAGKVFGEGKLTLGELVLNNADGALDVLRTYGMDGRQARVLVGDERAAYPGGFTVVLAATMEQPELSAAAVTIRLRDAQYSLDRPAQPTRYAGTNALPNGLEGVADDLKGAPKPILYGVVKNITPPRVNTARLIFQVNDVLAGSTVVDAVYDAGVSLTKGADYASQADMETTAPAAGAFRCWPAGGYFRLGSTPVGEITADCTHGAAGTRTAAQVWQLLLDERTTLAGGAWSAADVAALDAIAAGEIGLFVADDVALTELLDQVAASVGAWWAPDRLGVLRLQQLQAPSGTPVAVLTTSDLLRCELVASADAVDGLPLYRAVTTYARNWTPQTSGLAGSVTEARRAWLAAADRRAVATDASVQTVHLLAREREFPTLLATEAAAQAEATRLQALLGVLRDRLEVTVQLTAEVAAAIDLGAVVQVVHNRYNLSGGKLFRVIGVDPDARLGRFNLTLWG